ncbi:MAG TPA: PPOX class F420-dependent oxidoreductase [Segeticoccus sp.]|nr:PPOX class F420-dependent oxidoreductase [Segeticoccus sp.]
MSRPDDPALHQLLADQAVGTLAALKRDGRPQLSNVSYAYDFENTGERTILISITDGRAKTQNLRRDARASLLANAQGGWSYAVAEGDVELSPVAAAPADATADELVEVYRRIGGEHPDWQEYREAMVADRRLVLRLRVSRVYGLVR